MVLRRDADVHRTELDVSGGVRAVWKHARRVLVSKRIDADGIDGIRPRVRHGGFVGAMVGAIFGSHVESVGSVIVVFDVFTGYYESNDLAIAFTHSFAVSFPDADSIESADVSHGIPDDAFADSTADAIPDAESDERTDVTDAPPDDIRVRGGDVDRDRDSHGARVRTHRSTRDLVHARRTLKTSAKLTGAEKRIVGGGTGGGTGTDGGGSGEGVD